MFKLNGRFTDSKGQGLTVLMVAIIGAALISGLVAVVMVDNLPAIYGDFVDDGALISETEFRHDNIVENYIPTAVHYSVAQASWEVGTGDLPDIDSEYVGVQDEPSDGMNWSDEIYPEYDTMIEWVDNQSDSRFRDYIKNLHYDRCQVSMLEASQMDVNPQWDTSDGMSNITEVEALNDADALVNTSCQDFTRTVNYTGSKSYLRVPIVNNKFPQLATLTVGAIAEMENVSEQLDTDLDDGEVSDFSGCYDTKSQAENNVDAKSEAEDKVQEFIDAIVDEEHGIGSGSGDRGAREYLKEKTDTPKMCFILCVDNWLSKFSDVPVRDLVVENIDVAYEDGDAVSTSQCGCEHYDCTESGYSYVGSCQPTDAPYPDANCDNPDRSGPTNCDNANLTCDGTSDSSEVLYHGDDTELFPSLEECRPKPSEYPSPTCVDKRWNASETHKYDIDSIEVNVTLVDDEYDREIPTDDGFKHLVVSRTYYRKFTSDGSYEDVN